MRGLNAHDHHLLVKNNNKNILEGYRNYEDGLWDTPINALHKMPLTHPGLCKRRANHVKQAKFPTQNIKIKSPKPLPTAHSSITNSEIDREIARINYITNKSNVILRKKNKQKVI